MIEYEKQGIDFCNKWGIEIKWVFVATEINKEWDDECKRNHWHWIILRNGKTTQGEFWDSVANTEKTYQDPNKHNNPLKPMAYDLLACLTKEEFDSFKEFCGTFGYDEDSRKAYQTYEVCQKEYKGLLDVFGDDETLWEEFREIW